VKIPRRWLVLSIFVLSSTINYLDRQTLATLAPVLRADMRLSNADYGWIVAAFSITYAVCAPFAGVLIDRIGLYRGISLAIAVWSLAGLATGWIRGFGDLLLCRAALGIAEAGGIPAAGKAIQQYLKPAERALGNSLNQAGVSLGLILAPPSATWIAVRYGWRAAFMATAVVGLLWIQLWRAFGSDGEASAPAGALPSNLLRDRRLWGFAAANPVSLIRNTHWTNWSTRPPGDVKRWEAWPAAPFRFAG
jgi:ACS family hexuronate transporter-like MFS transporter